MNILSVQNTMTLADSSIKSQPNYCVIVYLFLLKTQVGIFRTGALSPDKSCLQQIQIALQRASHHSHHRVFHSAHIYIYIHAGYVHSVEHFT